MPEPDDRPARSAVTDWTRYAIFWGVFPLGFTGGEDVLDDPDSSTYARENIFLYVRSNQVGLGQVADANQKVYN